jgi:hypothetical protein
MRPLVLGLVALLLGTSCLDPVHQDAVDELGPEAKGEEPGPTHRRGQPCLTCHGGKGPGSPEFSVAGTVYAVRGGSDVAPGVTVVITDLDGRSKSVVTNRAGNFFIEKEQWDPVFPLHVRLEGGDKPKEMISRIGGNGSCASCHRTTGDNRHMPAVYLSEQ